MPLDILFYGHKHGLFSEYYVHERLARCQQLYCFIPEHFYMKNNIYDQQLITDELIRAITIVKSYRLHENDLIPYFEFLDDFKSHQLRVQAAILQDDIDWLRKLASDECCIFSSSILGFAAYHGSIACFRYLSINQCKYTPWVIDCAIHGGNEEIIQMCIENDSDPKTPSAFQHSIAGMQNSVTDWLINIHGVEVQCNDVIHAFHSLH